MMPATRAGGGGGESGCGVPPQTTTGRSTGLFQPARSQSRDGSATLCPNLHTISEAGDIGLPGRLKGTRRLSPFIALEGGCPQPPRFESIPNRRPANPVVAIPGRIGASTSVSRRPGTAALQALARNQAVVTIHRIGGRLSPAAEIRTDPNPTPRRPRRGKSWPRYDTTRSNPNQPHPSLSVSESPCPPW